MSMGMDMYDGDGLSSSSSSIYPSADYEMGAVVEGDGMVTNLDFHSDGKMLVMSTNQGAIHLIDCMSGEEKKRIHCKSTGISQLKYTHHESSVLMCTDKRSYDTKYISLHDNSCLRTFSGHSDAITSLSMNCVDDSFLTASMDKTVRKWDLSSPKETAKITLPSSFGCPYVSYDSSGIVFGVLSQNKDYSHTLRLYDARNASTGPFQDICPADSLQMSALTSEYPQIAEEAMAKPVKSSWTSFEFCRDGNHILINTDSEIMWLIDSYRSDIAPKILAPRKNDSSLKLGSCFSGDAKSVIAGTEDNELLVFNKESCKVTGSLLGHVSPVGCIASNPKYDMFASGCVNTVLWLPKESQ